jgi:malate synthase
MVHPDGRFPPVSRPIRNSEQEMTEYVPAGGLKISRPLFDLLRDEIAPGTGIEPETVWKGLGDIVADLAPRNQAMLDRRDELQAQIDAFYLERKGTAVAPGELEAFLREIGYLVDEGDDFEINTTKVDAEVSTISGPQLVVPVDNARYALNAANARWGSLYDAFYGTDVIPEDDGAHRSGPYNPVRGDKVIAQTDAFLDQTQPLAEGSWAQVTGFAVVAGALALTLEDGETTTLADPERFAGYNPKKGPLTSVLLERNGLHIDIQIDPEHPVGKSHKAGVKDVAIESAVSTIMDCEDSVAAVDADDKVRVYHNWTGIMKGSLNASFEKDGQLVDRTLRPDRSYIAPNGEPLILHGRSLLLVRNVGAHMLTDIVTTEDDEPVPETFIDAMITVMAAVHDLVRGGSVHNSTARSVYIVKPKHHGPEEVALSVELFGRIERVLGLEHNTIKIAHGHGGRCHDPQAGDQERALDARLRGLERRRRPRGGPGGARPDRQGHVGDARRDEGDAGVEARASGGRCFDGLGAVADGRHPARAALPHGRRHRSPAGAGIARARQPRRHPDAAPAAGRSPAQRRRDPA